LRETEILVLVAIARLERGFREKAVSEIAFPMGARADFARVERALKEHERRGLIEHADVRVAGYRVFPAEFQAAKSLRRLWTPRCAGCRVPPEGREGNESAAQNSAKKHDFLRFVFFRSFPSVSVLLEIYAQTRFKLRPLLGNHPVSGLLDMVHACEGKSGFVYVSWKA
jgi:hypothetical protein